MNINIKEKIDKKIFVLNYIDKNSINNFIKYNEEIKNESFKIMNYLYPLSKYKKDTDVNFGKFKIFIHKELRRSHYSISKELQQNLWVNNFCEKDNKELVGKVAEFIEGDKKDEFINLHNIFFRMKLLTKNKYNGMKIERKIDNALKYHTYNITYNYSDNIEDEKHYLKEYNEHNIVGIEYDGEYINILTDTKNEKGEFKKIELFQTGYMESLHDVNFINIIDYLYDTIISMIDEYADTYKKNYEHDLELLKQAKMITAKYEVLSKL
jgi:hypothetical protein